MRIADTRVLFSSDGGGIIVKKSWLLACYDNKERVNERLHLCRSDDDDDDDEDHGGGDDDDDDYGTGRSRPKRKAKTAAAKKMEPWIVRIDSADAELLDHDDLDDEAEDVDEPKKRKAPKRKATTQRATAKRQRKKVDDQYEIDGDDDDADGDDDEQDYEPAQSIDDDDDDGGTLDAVEEDDDDQEIRPAKGKRKPRVTTAATAKKPVTSPRATARATPSRIEAASNANDDDATEEMDIASIGSGVKAPSSKPPQALSLVDPLAEDPNSPIPKIYNSTGIVPTNSCCCCCWLELTSCACTCQSNQQCHRKSCQTSSKVFDATF
jgi:hypothetical protein